MADYTVEQIEAAIRVADKNGRREDVLRLGKERERLLSSQKQGGRSMAHEAARQVGLTGRAILGGLTQTAEIVTEPWRHAVNLVRPGTIPQGLEESADNLLTAAGVAEPENTTERVVQGVGRFATGFGTGLGIEKGVVNAAQKLTGMARSLASNKIPSADELRTMARTAYQAADDAGVVINPQSFSRFTGDVADMLKTSGVDRTLHPNVTAAMNRLKEAADAGEPLKLKDFEILRRVVGGAAKGTNKDEIRLAYKVRDMMDDYMGRMSSADVLGGDPAVASESLKVARNAWMRLSRSEEIAWAIQRAKDRSTQFSGSGFENALRTEFRQILMNKKRLRGFSKTEQDAIRRVAEGGKIGNAMRMLGKLAPTGVVSAGIGMGGGYAVAGGPGALLLPAIGAASRRGATRSTTRAAERAEATARAGGEIPKTSIDDAPEWLRPWLVGTVFGADKSEEQ